MTLAQAQHQVDAWIKSTGIRYFDELTNMVVLMEEVGELARIAARRYGEQSAKTKEKTLNWDQELADVFFVLLCLANQTGVDLTQAFQRNLKRKSRRDARRHRNNPKLIRRG